MKGNRKMKQMLKKTIMPALAAAALALAVTAEAAVMYVTGSGAELKANPDSAAGTIATLNAGDEVDVGELSGRWYKATARDGRAGWIYRGKVTAKKPEGGKAQGDLFGGMLTSKVKADSADTSRSIRGLSPEAEQYADQTGSPATHRKALDHVVAMRPSEEEVRTFLKEGRIGEYAR